jgi:hypothetical protein
MLWHHSDVFWPLERWNTPEWCGVNNKCVQLSVFMWSSDINVLTWTRWNEAHISLVVQPIAWWRYWLNYFCVSDLFLCFFPPLPPAATLGFTMLWPKNHIWRLCGNFGQEQSPCVGPQYTLYHVSKVWRERCRQQRAEKSGGRIYTDTYRRFIHAKY